MECGMERRFHRGFTAAEKTELWDRWKRGESLKAIGRAFGKESSSIYVGDQHRRLFLRSAKPVAARIEREHQWPAETVLSSGHRLVGAFASSSEQSGSSAKRTTT